jgi:predicted SprT family Zn-dependent metalloprotease
MNDERNSIGDRAAPNDTQESVQALDPSTPKMDGVVEQLGGQTAHSGEAPPIVQKSRSQAHLTAIWKPASVPSTERGQPLSSTAQFSRLNRDPRKFNSKREISALIKETRETLGYTPRIRWRWGNGNMTSTMGRAHSAKREVWFSHRLWKRASLRERRNTIVHEVCHIVAGCEHHHREPWRKLMRQCGEKPTRCHNVRTFKRRRRHQIDRRQRMNCPVFHVQERIFPPRKIGIFHRLRGWARQTASAVVARIIAYRKGEKRSGAA